MTISRSEFPEKSSFIPKEVTKGVLYKAESYTEDGEKIDLYMELLTDDNINKWNAYMNQAISSASELIASNPSKKAALNEVSRAIYAQNFSKGEYVIYALKHGAESTLPITDHNSESVKDFEQKYGNILMSFHSEWVPKETMTGYILNKQSYQNRGIFRNPVSIIENKHKGLAMLLHGFSASVAQIFFPEKKSLHVSPIGSMQYILFHSLPREAFNITDENYALIKSAATTKSGSEVVDNYIKTEELFKLYLETSTRNEIRAKYQTSETAKSTPQKITRSYRQSVNQDRNTIENDEITSFENPDRSKDVGI